MGLTSVAIAHDAAATTVTLALPIDCLTSMVVELIESGNVVVHGY